MCSFVRFVIPDESYHRHADMWYHLHTVHCQEYDDVLKDRAGCEKENERECEVFGQSKHVCDI